MLLLKLVYFAWMELIYISCTNALPSLVTKTPMTPDNGISIEQAIGESIVLKPKVVAFNIKSSITARYVSTFAITTIHNPVNSPSQEVNFAFRLSKEAFISNFSMTVNGIVYQSHVKEKEAAQKVYNEAKRRGQTAAQVKQKDKDGRHFAVNVNLSSNTTAIFNLTFQEMLRRQKGVFEHRINISPGEIVQNLHAHVDIVEPQGVAFVNASWQQDRSNASDFDGVLSVTRPGRIRAKVLFNPSAEYQAKTSATGLSGDLVVMYDVVHDQGAGDIQIVNGYFVHHISPEGLPVTRKNIVFAIDVSGSMIVDNKLVQTVAAMNSILEDVRDIDRFNIITFESVVKHWRTQLVPATKENKRAAMLFVQGLRASGGTNIHSAALNAAGVFERYELDNPSAFSLIILLTDGVPTYGQTNVNQIVVDVTARIARKYALFTIGFGGDVDDKFLDRLAANNQGLYRKVYTDSNAALQLKEFYDQVATPLLFNVAVDYDSNAIDANTITQNNFISYFNGEEIVIAGKLADNFTGNSLNAVVSGNSFDVTLEWETSKEISQDAIPSAEMVDDFAQRMWAYITIKDLLKRREYAISNSEKEALKSQALQLSLKYGFVTPLTSLVVVKPDEEDDAANTEEDGEIEEEKDNAIFTSRSSTLTTSALTNTASLPSLSVIPRPPPVILAKRISRVFGDPHVVIDLPHNLSICFDIHGKDGAIINLIDDPVLDIVVNAEMVSNHQQTVSPDQKAGKNISSFFGMVYIQLGRNHLNVTRAGVEVNGIHHFSWATPVAIEMENWKVVLHNNSFVSIQSVKDVKPVGMNIIRHRLMREATDHFDLLVVEGGFSEKVLGVIGEFQHAGRVKLVEASEFIGVSGKRRAVLQLGDKEVMVTQTSRGGSRPCWCNLPEVFLTRSYTDYILFRPFQKLHRSVEA